MSISSSSKPRCDWQDRLDELLKAALELPSDQRLAFLDDQCDSTELRDELDRLLADSDRYFRIADLDYVQEAFAYSPDNRPVGKGADSEDEPIPARIGRYRVEKRAGRGGFGVVYVGIDEELKRQVAIKVPRGDRIRDPQDVEAYLNEARLSPALTTRISHPSMMSAALRMVAVS